MNGTDVAVGRLYIVPMPLGDVPPAEILPRATLAVISGLRHFVAENARTARRFLAQLPVAVPLQQLAIAELNEHTAPHALPSLLTPIIKGHAVGLLSEAGCPVVADPGAPLIALAHEHGIPVTPLVGPTAPVLALMASGLSGQSFHFLGYLPQSADERRVAILRAERTAREGRATQIFIETPYRNVALFEALLATCQETTLLSIAAELTLPSESVATRSIGLWRSLPRPTLERRPAVFVLGGPPPVNGRGGWNRRP